ncbi:septum formation initiator [Microlunatus elymi]|uniref:Septum formation initiator n=1 Tax=Microlunatus elymi TaxID=2596828 RepID=A0A516PV93_9ACTN|nr:septum site-determining protein Ssd [Microlunatus elymi]QDP95118.1 septum formation initiator [Microlunatus elymi]
MRADKGEGHAVRARRAGVTVSAAESARSPAQQPGPLVVTADLELLDNVLAAAAAAGVEPTVTAEPGSIRPLWSAAPLVVIGADRAGQVAELVLPHRTEVFVAGVDDDVAGLARWSAPLGAAVVGLPQGAGLLTAAIADATGRPSGSGRVVVVVGGSGGVGGSSVAAALAVGAADRGLSTMLVDLDRFGGGIDLLVGAESVAGWRWPRLSGAEGHLGDLTGHLPRVAGIDVLSVAREGELGLAPGPVKSVLLSATRSHRLVVVDLPRGQDPVAAEALRRAALTLVVAGADVRGIAAAQQLLRELRGTTAELGVVVRRPRGGGIGAQLVADALQLPLAGVVGEDASIRHGAERGDPPGRATRSPLGKLSRRLLDRLDFRDLAA